MPLTSWDVDVHRIADPSRLRALRATGLLDSPPEERFDRFAREATERLEAPAAMVTLVDEDRQFFKAATGLPEPVASARQTPLVQSLCKYAVQRGEPVLIEDVREHPRLTEDLAGLARTVTAYAGAPLVTGDGQVLGALCVLDSRPRAWTARDAAALQEMAAAVVDEIEGGPA